jgi:hypothetical protein
MKKTLKITVILLFVISICISNVKAAAPSPAISPTYINIDNKYRGAGSVEKTFFVENVDEIDHNVSLEISGDLKDWVTFYLINDLNTSINQLFIENNTYKLVLMNITFPEDIANGEYYSNITARFTEKTEGSNGTSVQTAQRAIVRFEIIGDQIINLTVKDIKIKNAELGYNVDLIFDLLNTGNVQASPFIKVDFYYASNNLHIDTIYTNFTTKPNGITEKYHLKWNTSNSELAQFFGIYRAEIKVFLLNEIIHQENLSFELYEKNSLERNITLEKFDYSGNLTKGSSININSQYKNSGELNLDVQFFGEIYRDGELLYETNSTIENIPINHTINFDTTLKLEEYGEYTIKTWVDYGDYLYPDSGTTEIAELNFKVKSPTETLTNPFLIFGIALIFVLLTFYFLFKKKIKITKNKKVKTKKLKQKTKQKTEDFPAKKNHKTKKRIKITRNKEKSPLKNLTKEKEGEKDNPNPKQKNTRAEEIEREIDKLKLNSKQ